MSKCYIITIVKHGGGSVIIWKCIVDERNLVKIKDIIQKENIFNTAKVCNFSCIIEQNFAF